MKLTLSCGEVTVGVSHRPKKEPGVPLAGPRSTEAWIKRGDEVLAEVAAVCSAQDNFDKAKGRELAAKRLLLALGDAAPHSKREAIQILASRIPFEPSAFLQLLDIRDHKTDRKQLDAKDVFTRYLAAVQRVTAAVDTMLDKDK